MKGLFILFLISFCFTACPNLCSGHGTCSRSGSCICYPGWTEGTCPYDNPYVQPEIVDDVNDPKSGDERSYLECAGQGECDRTTGLCQCYPGYEGTACQRQSCPNGCSGHGVCTPVKFLDINEKSQVSMNYEFLEDWKTSNPTDAIVTYAYDHWDKEQSFACLCDSEYEGYDCSQKKCPTGYFPTSDCDAPAQYTETITFTAAEKSSNSMAYLEYKDQLGRIWYSQHFSTTKQSKTEYCDRSTASPPYDQILGWEEALQTFAIGVIDVQVKCSVKNNEYSVLLTFGSQQTGRQEKIRIITNAMLGKDEFQYSDKSPSGYHGMRSEDLELCRLKVDDQNTYEIDTCEVYKLSHIEEDCPASGGTPKDNTYCLAYTYLAGNDIKYSFTDSLPPLPCSNNGICDTSTGLCNCFTGFYGLACTEQSALV